MDRVSTLSLSSHPSPKHFRERLFSTGFFYWCVITWYFMWTTLLLQGGRPSTQANVVLSFSFTLLNVSENQVRVLVIISFCLICSMAARALSSKVFPNSFSLSGKLSNVLDKSGAAWAGTGPAARGLQANPLAWGWVLGHLFLLHCPPPCFLCPAPSRKISQSQRVVF